MKILFSVLSLRNYTGSEVSTYELARQLVKQGNAVTIYSPNVGQPMLGKAEQEGIYVTTVMPAYRYDILHLQHGKIAEQVLASHPSTPAVNHVRSEVIPQWEYPVKHPNVKKYISIRNSITEYCVNKGVERQKIVEIPNGFDTQRFNTDYEFSGNTRERILFVGTLDHLRKEMLYDIAKLCKNTHKSLWIIGADTGGYLKDLQKHYNIEYFGVREDVENFYKICDYTVGVFDGRTTIEGWLCGVPAWLYVVDTSGKIKTKKVVEPPVNTQKYSLENHAKAVLEVYNEVKAVSN